jgi:LmbE family N-acetylglucosaminyl deacetylase
MKKVLVVAAHPDDEILGVGGTVAKHVAAGDKVYGLILGEGQTSRGEKREDIDKAVIDDLHKNTIESGKKVGYTDIFFENFPDNRFDRMDLLDIVKGVEKYVKEIQPEIIYTHYSGDLNIDHQYTARAVLTATRPIGDYPVKEIYAFETLSSSEWNFDYSTQSAFSPNVYVDITNYCKQKKEAMECYVSELCEFPHPRSLKGIEVLAQKRGMEVGLEYAESFMLIRKIK